MASDQKTPLSQAAPPAGRAQTTNQRSKVARRRAIGVGIAIAAVVGVGAYLLSGGDVPEIPIINPEPDVPTPDFAFDLQQSKYEATVAGGNKDAQAKGAEQAGKDVKATLDGVFFAGFVDPETWGDAGEIESWFTGDAADTIEDNLETLTLGPDAGDVYEYVDPGRSTLYVRVLTSEEGKALRAVAQVDFAATAEHTDATFSRITISGTFFLVPDGDEWVVEAYRASRLEKEIQAPASPTASTSPTEAAS